MRPIDVLLVEDNVGDEFLIALIVGEAPVPVRLHVARDGVEALFKLAQHGVHPDLVILDLNLPAVSGHDVLRLYHPNDVPVVVFSSSGKTQIVGGHSPKVLVNLFRSPAASRITSALFWG